MHCLIFRLLTSGKQITHKCQSRRKSTNPEHQHFAFVSSFYVAFTFNFLFLKSQAYHYHTLSKLVLKVYFFSLVGRQKFVREVLYAAPLVCESKEEAKTERLHFYRPAANSHTPVKWTPSTTNHQAKPSWHNIKKRQRQSERCDSSHQSRPTKRLSSSALTVEDIDLLNSY